MVQFYIAMERARIDGRVPVYSKATCSRAHKNATGFNMLQHRIAEHPRRQIDRIVGLLDIAESDGALRGAGCIQASTHRYLVSADEMVLRGDLFIGIGFSVKDDGGAGFDGQVESVVHQYIPL